MGKLMPVWQWQIFIIVFDILWNGNEYKLLRQIEQKNQKTVIFLLCKMVYYLNMVEKTAQSFKNLNKDI